MADTRSVSVILDLPETCLCNAEPQTWCRFLRPATTAPNGLILWGCSLFNTEVPDPQTAPCRACQVAQVFGERTHRAPAAVAG